MAMAIDHQQRFGAINFDHIPYSSAPHFTNPWTTAAAAASQNHAVYAPPTAADGLVKQESHQQPAHHHQQHTPQQPQHQQQQQHALPHHPLQHQPSLPPPHQQVQPSAQAQPQPAQQPLSRLHHGSVSMPAGYTNNTLPANGAADLLSPVRTMSASYGSEHSYTGAPSPVHNTYPPVSSPYESMGYAPAPVRSTYNMQVQDNTRRLSQPASHSDAARSFGDAIDASRGMIAMSQTQGPPRNLYTLPHDRSARGSVDSYGYPTAHSSSSSISSGPYPSYFGGSVDSSVSDYSTAGSDIDSVSSRTLPRPLSLTNAALPAPQSMMSQFSSKVSSSTQKKHKCKVCDKRFTRPSSLQTHMYSHTGEKPFSCEFEGCGRHFSVVSNLRRHRKVHKGGAPSDAGSDDHLSDS